MNGERLTDEQKDFIREFVAEAPTDTEKTQRRNAMAAEFGVSLPTIRAITAWTKIRQKKLLQDGGTAQPIDPIQEALPFPSLGLETNVIEHSGLTEPTDANNSITSSGEFADYNNELKEKWRKTWQKYLEEHTLERDRSNMRVLCLPGRECLEIPLYLELGFRASNIVGVEGGSEEIRNQFSESAARYGIQAKCGRLEDIVNGEVVPFDVISLDFHGNFSLSTVKALNNLPLQKTSQVMINLQGKREAEFAKMLMQHGGSEANKELNFPKQMMSVLRDSVRHRSQNKSMTKGFIEITQKRIEKEYLDPFEQHLLQLKDEHVPLKDARIASLVPLLLAAISNANNLPLQSVADVLKDEQSSMYVSKLTCYGGTNEVARMFSDWLSKQVSSQEVDLKVIEKIVEYEMRGMPWVEDCRTYKYASMSSRARSPFYTVCFSFHYEQSEVFRFIWDIFYKIFQDCRSGLKDHDISDIPSLPEQDPIRFSVFRSSTMALVRDFYRKNFRPYMPRSHRKRSDLFTGDSIQSRSGEKHLSSIPFASVVADIELFQSLSKRYQNALEILAGKKVPEWQEIQ